MKKSKKILFGALGLSLATLTPIVAFVSYKKPNKNLSEEKRNNIDFQNNHEHEQHEENSTHTHNENENKLIKNQIEQIHIKEEEMVSFNLNEKISLEKTNQEKTINYLNQENLIKNLNDVIHFESFDDIKNKLEVKLSKEIDNFKEKFGDIFSIQFIDLSKNNDDSLFNKVEKFYTLDGYSVFKIKTNAVFIASSQYPYGDIFKVNEFDFYLVSNIETNNKTNIELIRYQDLKVKEASLTKENDQIELVIKGENLNNINQDDLYLIKKQNTNLFSLNDNLIKNKNNEQPIEIVSQNETEIIARINNSNMPKINYVVGINNEYFPKSNPSILLTEFNANYSTFVETELVEINQKVETTNKINWNMNYSISWWNRNWDNETFTINLKGKGNNFNKNYKENEKERNRWPINVRIFEVQLPYVLRKTPDNYKNKYYADYFLTKNLITNRNEYLRKLLTDIKYFGDFSYADAIKCNSSTTTDSQDRKYNFFDGPGYGYALYNTKGFKTIKENENEVEFQIKLPPVKNKSSKKIDDFNKKLENKIITKDDLYDQNIYFTGGYIVVWNDNNDILNSKINKECKKFNDEGQNRCCEQATNDEQQIKCECIRTWKTNVEDSMKNTLLEGIQNSIFDFFVEHNDGTKENDPINHGDKW